METCTQKSKYLVAKQRKDIQTSFQRKIQRNMYTDNYKYILNDRDIKYVKLI